MIMDYTELQVGQEVAVAKPSSWHTSNQGVYIVAKVNKVKVIVHRKGDGYERTFSVKKRREIGKLADDTYTAAYLETVEEQAVRLAQYKREAEIQQLWREAAGAAAQRNLALLKQLVAELDAV